MKFGVREICDVVFRAKTNMKIGNKQFFKHEPVIYFDSLKTSTLEGAVTTVYAQGGKGNARLVAWDGEKTVTFTMEDALISPLGLQILAGAGLIEADNTHKIKVHTTHQTKPKTVTESEVTIEVKGLPYTDDESDEHFIYVMALDENGDVATEPYCVGITVGDQGRTDGNDTYYTITIPAANNDLTEFATNKAVLVDYYVEKDSDAYQIDIKPTSLGGNFYIEASTLFRNQQGVDMPAEFIIPNGKVQSNFTFTMASTGDPSTFTFTLDAFPDYTRFDLEEKVFASIQVITETGTTSNSGTRTETYSGYEKTTL